MSMKRGLTLFDVVLMNLVAVASLRWIASAASMGPSSLTLWILAAGLFFLPQALAVAELSSRFPESGGLYRWTQRSFGERHAFFCGWCYWVNNLLYFPALLLYVSSNAALSLGWLNPQWRLAENNLFVVSVTIGTLWVITLLSIVGMRIGKLVQNLGALGNWIPALLVAILGGVAWMKYGSANVINLTTVLPDLSRWQQLSFFSQMCFALAGLELVSFLGGEINDPKVTITRGILISAILIVSIYMVGTLGVLAAIPKERVTLLNGLLQPIEEVSRRWNLLWIAGIAAALIAFGAIASTLAWFSGVARLPYIVGLEHYLPASFGKQHPKYETPYIAILVQAGAATLLTLLATAGASTKMETAYRILVDMCLILYFIPYCYLFLSLFKLRKKGSGEKASYEIPGGKWGNGVVAAVGLSTTFIAILTALVPALETFDPTATAKTVGGTLFMLIIGYVLYYRGCQRRQVLLTST